ncbi:8069_t:CDS:2, partial [Gigaspora margarita]
MDNPELRLGKLETIEEFEIELIKNRTRSIDIEVELIDRFQKIRDRGIKNLVFYTDGSLKVEEELSSNIAQIDLNWVLVDKERNLPSSTKPELLAIWA